MAARERERTSLEYKREYTDDIIKTVIAFANTSGGTLYVGIADNGEVYGLEDIEQTALRVSNALRDAVRPDITMFISLDHQQIEGKAVLAVHVQAGTARPYYLSGKGVRPEGVFVRQGASTVPASESVILRMIKETSGDDYESARSLQQSLSFHSASQAFSREGIAFGAQQQRSLGIIGQDGAYTNLGLLLSDQCIHGCRIAVFEGLDKTTFKDRTELGGSLLKQMDEAYAFIDRHNGLRAEYSGLRREELRDYPPVAIREALLNALVHRDYSFSGSMLISLFDDRVELVSLGGLPRGITYADLSLGISVLRNSRLAEVFYRLHLIEAYGTGLSKITQSYQGAVRQPQIEVSDNAFKITLPNRNVGGKAQPSALDGTQARVLALLRDRSPLSRAEVEQALQLSQGKALRALSALVDQGLLTKLGSARNTRYAPR